MNDFLKGILMYGQNSLLTSYVEQTNVSADKKTLLKLKFLNAIKLAIKIIYIYIFLKLWNKTLMYLKYSLISVKEYDSLMKVVENKNIVIANAAKQLLLRKPNRHKNEEVQLNQKFGHKKVLSSHF